MQPRSAELPRPLPEGRSYDVVGFGLNAVDHLCSLQSFPHHAGKMLLDGYDCRPGGPVATAVVALQRWGLRTAYVGAFGDDAFGELATHNRKPQAGVDARRLAAW